MSYVRAAFVATVAALVTYAHSRSMIEAVVPFVPDSTLQRTDSIPPEAPIIRVKQVWRGCGVFRLDGNLVSQDAEGDHGSITLVVTGAMSRQNPDEIGYRYHYVDGLMPERLDMNPSEAWCPHGWNGDIWLSIGWDDGRTWRQDPFNFRMYVTAVDRAGNQSPPSNVVRVADSGMADVHFERQAEVIGKVRSLDNLAGNWLGKDQDGVDAFLSLEGRQLRVSSGKKTLEGFAQVWDDEAGEAQITVDVSEGVGFTGSFELESGHLRLRLRSMQVPYAHKSYDLRRK